MKKISVVLFVCSTLLFIACSLKSPSMVHAAKMNPNKAIREENTITAESCIIGQDVPEGEYLVVSSKNFLESRKDFYFGGFDIYSDSYKTEKIYDGSVNVPIEGITSDGILSKAKFKKKKVNEFSAELVYLKSGQMITFNNTKMYPAEFREKINPKKVFEGMYKIGRDIPPGTYKTESYVPGGGEYLHTLVIMNSVDPSLDSDNWIKSYQDYSDESYPDKITLNEGEYIYFSDLILKLQKKK